MSVDPGHPSGCYYRLVGTDGDDRVFDSTDFTRSNWGPNLQHGSPPLALLTAAVEELIADSGLRIARLGMDILGAVPVARVRVRARVARPGRRIRLLTAEMYADDTGREVARLSAWAIATSDTRAVATDRHPPLPDRPVEHLPSWWDMASGYFDSVRWRYQGRQPDDTAVAWLAPLVHVVDTDPTTALQRLAAVVDSANGIGAALDIDRFMFMNTDTVVHLHRLPVGNDFGMRARASVGPDGIGVTTAELFDHIGHVGSSAQTLLIEPRDPPRKRQ